MKQPYIGITDFESIDQVENMLSVFEANRQVGSNRKLMVGLMMSHKTLNGLPTKWADVFLPNERIHELFLDHPLVMNTLHYADYKGIAVYDNLMRATEYGGEHMHALQLDMVWPNAAEVLRYHVQHPQVEIVLQINSNAFDIAKNDPHEIKSMLDGYEGAVQYALLDKSMGKGIGLNADFLYPFVDMIVKNMPHIGVAVAGGLGPHTMHLIESLVRDYPFISFDAQGNLRPSRNAMDPIDWNWAAEYLKSGLQLVV